MGDDFKKRHEAIMQIISQQMVQDQSTLAKLLKQKYGIAITQVQASRDLKKLGVGKKMVGKKMVYELPETNLTQKILRLAIVDVQHNESLIVIKTIGGIADFVGDYLDEQDDIGILGTISGENTIFITPDSTKRIDKIYSKVCLALYYKTPTVQS